MITRFVPDVNDAVAGVESGHTLMVGGFGGAGFPFALRDALSRRGLSDLTVIANNADFGALADAGSLKRMICSFPTGPTSGSVIRGIEESQIELLLTPQGTLVEQIHAGGSGLGGFLTPTGRDTELAARWSVVDFQGESYLLVPPLRADVALIKASVADEMGNLVHHKASRNFNPLMAMAADLTVAQVDRVVPSGELDPDMIHVPSVFVDVVVVGGARSESH